MPDIRLDMPAEEITRAVFEGAAQSWAERDVECTLDYFSDDIVHVVNVDSEQVPYAKSGVGKVALRERLKMILDIFDFGAYITDHLTISGRIARAQMKIIYIHKKTGERLVTNYRLVVEQRGGRIAKIEEFHDASYLEAFTRFVEFRGNSDPAPST